MMNAGERGPLPIDRLLQGLRRRRIRRFACWTTATTLVGLLLHVLAFADALVQLWAFGCCSPGRLQT